MSENPDYLLLDENNRPSRCSRCKQSITAQTIRIFIIVIIIASCIIAVIVLNNHFKSHRDPAAEICESWVTEYHIVPDAVGNCPQAILDIKYFDHSTNLTYDIPYAASIPPANISSTSLPSLTSSIFQPDRRYMFWIVDPDFPTAYNASYRSRVYAFYKEVIGTNPLTFNHSADQAIYPYQPLQPLFGSGSHRYVFVVYDTTNLPYTIPNGTFPWVHMNMGAFMSAIFNTDMSGQIAAGNFFTSECTSLSCAF